MFGQPVSIQLANRQTHKTALGGIVSLVIICVMLGYSAWRIMLFSSRERDYFFATTFFQDFIETGFVPLMPNYDKAYSDISFQFELYVNDATYDNDDNPYAKIKFHRYSNMANSTDYNDNNNSEEAK